MAIMTNLKILYAYIIMYYAMIFSSLEEFSKKDFIIWLNLEMSISLISLGNLNNLKSLVSIVCVEKI